ncbi:MFS transporter [Nocardioides sp.]|uniref:MFS transporter n=1 Tax=Nocardioides sp. TaxID=35761 RepID=UPI0031FED81D|nr:Major Facilitator Superfamily protein [Nocardioides sp.]
MTTPGPDASGEQRWREPHPDPVAPGDGGTAGDRARAVGRGVGTSAKVTARGVRGMAQVAGRFGRFTLRQAKRAAGAEGAEQSGLSRLIYMHVFNTAGDAAVAISLAGSLFFQVPSGEARGQVALFLGLTMLPFAIVAPLIGPFLDRFSHGRRWAIGATMALRAFLCWGMAGAINGDTAWLFAAALGVLVSSKAYGVTRAAAVPRLLPKDFTLVKANGRVSMSGIIGATVSAPIAALASLVGPEWSLRYAFVLFVIATVCAVRLPAQVDSSAGEGDLVLRGATEASARRPERQRTRIPGPVAFALRANCGPRWLSGFLLMFMAFLLRESPPDTSLNSKVLIGIVIGAAGLGNALGVGAASVFRRINPALTVVIALLADTAAALAATLFYGVVPLAVLGLTAGLSQALAKLSLDSTIQRDIPTRVQASAFARSDTTLQLAWVIGGFVGIALPLDPARLGLGVAFAVLAAWTTYVLATGPRQRAGVAAAAVP